jgi:predicted dienelactone hydrolase
MARSLIHCHAAIRSAFLTAKASKSQDRRGLAAAMFRLSVVAVGHWFLATALAHASNVVGFLEIDVDKAGIRPLHIGVWYPTDDNRKTSVVGETAAFFGVTVVRDAVRDLKIRPLVVVSHGYGGSWRNLDWLAVVLAEQGYIVAAPDHPGTSTSNRDPAQAARLWERPRDLSRTIDALVADPGLAGKVDVNRIAAIGHSLGGWTVTALAGGRFDAARFEKDCKANNSLRACALDHELGLDQPQPATDLGDPRLKAFVSLDLGLARGFSPQSLGAIHVPSLLIGAGVDVGGLPAALESGYLAEHLPKKSSTYVVVPDAMHFSFIGLCKPGAVAMIEKEEPGDGVVCKDGGTRSREAIHHEVAERVIGFLAEALPPRVTRSVSQPIPIKRFSAERRSRSNVLLPFSLNLERRPIKRRSPAPLFRHLDLRGPQRSGGPHPVFFHGFIESCHQFRSSNIVDAP